MCELLHSAFLEKLTNMKSTYRTLIAIAGLNLLAIAHAAEPTAWPALE